MVGGSVLCALAIVVDFISRERRERVRIFAREAVPGERPVALSGIASRSAKGASVRHRGRKQPAMAMGSRRAKDIQCIQASGTP